MNLNPLAPLRARREQRALEVSSELYKTFIGAYASNSGVTVNKDTALTSVAVTGCLIVRAETFASLPADVISRSGTSRVSLGDHAVARLLSGRWNELLTAPEGWRWKQLTEDLTGNAYIRVEFRNGRPFALWPMTGEKPAIKIANGSIAYEYKGDDFTPAGVYAPSEILHFKGPILATPYEGKSLVDVARETIGLSIATEQFYARMVSNGNHFPKHLETDASLKPDDVKAIQESLRQFSGLSSAGAMRIFDRGLKVVTTGMSMKDADLTEEQRWLLEQICRVFRVPKSLVQDWSDNTYSNAEQANLWFAQHTITPICINTEKVLNTRLFLDSERGLYVKFNVNGLLRGDFKTRMDGYKAAIEGGFMVRNQARDLEDWNPIEGLDKPLVPLNMAVVGEDGNVEGVADLRDRIDALGSLVRSGYDPKQTPAVVGLPDIPYLDAQPVTLRPVDDSGIQVAPADAAPIIDDARARIITRAKQDAERGRDAETTRAFAERVVAPLVAAGLITDPDAFVSDALGSIDSDKEADSGQ